MNFARSNSSTLVKYHITTDVSLPYTPVIDNVSLFVLQQAYCYDSKLKVLSNELTLVLSNTRELDRVPNTK